MNPAAQAEATVEFLARATPGRGDLGDNLGAEFLTLARERIESDGAAQYHDPTSDTMLFETMDPDALYRYTEEEALDLANYAYMLYSRAGYEGERLAAAQLARRVFWLWHDIRVARDAALAARRFRVAESRIDAG